MGKREAPWLDAWPALEPDPAEMERVAAMMVAGTAPQVQAPDPAESHFRTIAYVWAVVGLVGYLVWPSLADWYLVHPFWVILGVSGGVASLLVPVVLEGGITV